MKFQLDDFLTRLFVESKSVTPVYSAKPRFFRASGLNPNRCLQRLTHFVKNWSNEFGVVKCFYRTTI